MKTKEFTEDDEKPVIGLVNGGYTTLECSACGKGLIDIKHTQPKAIDPATMKPFLWKMQAICCYCGDHSYATEIKGKFYMSGYAKDKEADNADTQPGNVETKVINGEEILVIQTVKAK